MRKWPKNEKVWESVLKAEKAWESALKTEKVWESMLKLRKYEKEFLEYAFGNTNNFWCAVQKSVFIFVCVWVGYKSLLGQHTAVKKLCITHSNEKAACKIFMKLRLKFTFQLPRLQLL